MPHPARHFLRTLRALSFCSIAIGAAWPAAAQGDQRTEDFVRKVDRVMREHRLIKMTQADQNSAAAAVDVEKSAYLPKLTLQVNAGSQEIKREQGSSGRFKPQEQTLSLNQLIYDFGATGSRVRTAEQVVEKERLEGGLQRQNLLLAMVESQLSLVRAVEGLKYAQQSETNIKRQTQLENGRMEAGRGYATDVLQAKAQLAGAEARRVSADRLVQEAVNRYESVFGYKPTEGDRLQGLRAPMALLPQSIAELDDSVLKDQNPDVLAANARAAVAMAERDMQRRRELAPRLDLVAARSRYEEYDGTLGSRNDTKLHVRLSWSFDLGMRLDAVTRMADFAATSAVEKAEYVRNQALEEARNAWSSWMTARERAGYLANQVAIASSFLELGRKERELGRRSLLDLLNGETGLINAQSDAMAARIDEVLASYRVLRAAGRVSPAVFALPGVVVPASELTRIEGTVSQMAVPGAVAAKATSPGAQATAAMNTAPAPAAAR